MSRDRRTRDRVVVYRAQEPGGEAPHEVRYGSVADALHFACRDLRAGRRRPLEIVEDGTVVMDAARIEAACHEAREQMEARLEDAAESGPHP